MTLNPAKDMQPIYPVVDAVPIAKAKAKDDCCICYGNVKALSRPPPSHMCKDRKGISINKKACKECWEAHISAEVEVKPFGQVACMFCPEILVLNRQDKKLCDWSAVGARVDNKYRYDMKHTNATRYKCMARCQGQNTPLQSYSRTADGRIFICNLCSFAVCTDCDRPEHVGQTCEEYQSQLLAHHKEDEAATSLAFPKCPECHTPFTVEKGCGYVQCAPGNKMAKVGITGGCGHRFCEHCMIPWTGDASAYLGGQMQHGTTSTGALCKYYVRDHDSDHGLSHRFDKQSQAEMKAALPEVLHGKFQQQVDKTEAEKEKRAEQKRKREAKKADADADAAEAGDGGETKQPAEKKRKISKSKVIDGDAEDEDPADLSQSAEDSSPKPAKVRKGRGKKAAGEETGPEAMSPEDKAKREKQALRREKRKGIEQKKREMDNPSAEMLEAWEKQFGSAAT